MRISVLGLAGAIIAVSLITPAAALPRPSGVTAPSLVQEVDRRCWWKHGHRHCRYEPAIVIDLGNHHHRRHHDDDHHGNDHHDNDHHDNDRHDNKHGDKH